VSFAMNSRFLFGFLEMKRAMREVSANEMQRAADSMENAAAHVPEAPEFVYYSALFRGAALLQADDNRAAVGYLQKAVALERRDPRNPDANRTQLLLLNAELG